MNTHWNCVIAPHIEQSIVDQAMGVANAGAQKQIVNTALYVLLHRTITVGCPLKDQERDNYLSTFRGSCAKGILLPANDLCDNACSIPSITTASIDSNEAIDPSLLVESLSLSEPAKKEVNMTDDSPEPKQRKNLKNDFDKGKRQTLTSKNNVQKPFLGSPGNTAPRVLRVKAPSTGPVTASRTIPKVTSSIMKLSSGRSASLTSSIKSASSSSSAKMSTSLHHLRTASPANLGRVASTSKTANSNK